MTDTQRRGLDLACALLAREIEAGNAVDDLDAESRAAIDWIRRQQTIDARRRIKRGNYRRGPRV